MLSLLRQDLAKYHAAKEEIGSHGIGEWHHKGVTIVLGTTKLLRQRPELIRDITAMVNTSYTEALKTQLSPGSVYTRVDEEDVLDRLRMGDSGIAFSNRVLLLAFLDGALAGCVSSTYAPPWTPDGCGHWGLLVVDVAYQGKGVANALVFAAERRVAGACAAIQIEYDHHADPYSDRLEAWYEGKLGFTCTSGGRSRRGGSFRRCQKLIPEFEKAIARWQRLQQIVAYLTEERAKAVTKEAKRHKSEGAAPADSVGGNCRLPTPVQAPPSGDEEQGEEKDNKAGDDDCHGLAEEACPNAD